MATAMPREVQRLLAQTDTVVESIEHATKTGRALNVVR